MKNLNVYALHSNIKDTKGVVHSLKIKDVSIIKCLVWNEESPNYVIATEQIYSNTKLFKKFIKFLKRENVVTIFLASEAIAPDLNIFDYAICFDRHLCDLDRVCFMPQMLFYNSSGKQINDYTYKEALLSVNQRRFCNFIYSNPLSHKMRDLIFHKLSEYKNVDSYGSHLNNMGNVPTRKYENWKQLSIALKSKYKFTIAAENARYEGYTSEKLITSFQSHSIPIYWGNPDVTREWNPQAFINCNDYNSMDELLKEVERIDRNDEVWATMVSQPWQTKGQIKQQEKDTERYYSFIGNIFEQELRDAIRKPAGTWNDNYRFFFGRKYSMIYVFYIKVKKSVQKIKIKIVNKGKN